MRTTREPVRSAGAGSFPTDTGNRRRSAKLRRSGQHRRGPETWWIAAPGTAGKGSGPQTDANPTCIYRIFEKSIQPRRADLVPI